MNVDFSKVQKILDWAKTQIYLDAGAIKAKIRTVKRGQVYWVNFGCGIGSEMQKDRPAVVIQNDPSNKSSGNTIVIPITHDTAVLSCMAPITTQCDASGNTILDGQANTSNLMCVSKARIGNYICDLPATDMKAIEEALAKTVDLMKHYADIKNKYDKKVQYLEVVKQARNAAQDELTSIRTELGIDAESSILHTIRELKSKAEAHRNAEKNIFSEGSATIDIQP